MAEISFNFRDILEINIQLISAFKIVHMAKEEFSDHLQFLVLCNFKKIILHIFESFMIFFINFKLWNPYINKYFFRHIRIRGDPRVT